MQLFALWVVIQLVGLPGVLFLRVFFLFEYFTRRWRWNLCMRHSKRFDIQSLNIKRRKKLNMKWLIKWFCISVAFFSYCQCIKYTSSSWKHFPKYQTTWMQITNASHLFLIISPFYRLRFYLPLRALRTRRVLLVWYIWVYFLFVLFFLSLPVAERLTLPIN